MYSVHIHAHTPSMCILRPHFNFMNLLKVPLQVASAKSEGSESKKKRKNSCAKNERRKEKRGNVSNSFSLSFILSRLASQKLLKRERINIKCLPPSLPAWLLVFSLGLVSEVRLVVSPCTESRKVHFVYIYILYTYTEGK